MSDEKFVLVGHIEMADVLRALYDASFSAGLLGRIHFTPEPMTRAQAQALIDQRIEYALARIEPENREQYIRRHALYFDYLQGRVMKINLAERRALFVALYDRDNGRGAARRALYGRFPPPAELLATASAEVAEKEGR